MVAYSFKSRFRERILAGIKDQTIRAPRKRHARPGEQLQLFTGMRTKHCKLIARATCIDVAPIRILVRAHQVELPATGTTHTTIEQLDAFARRDGFLNWMDMLDFWQQEHPDLLIFSGYLIRWNAAEITGAEII